MTAYVACRLPFPKGRLAVLATVHSTKVCGSAWPGPNHRQKKVGSGCFVAVKVGTHIADSEVARLIAPQDRVIPASLPAAFGDRADEIPRPVAKPFYLPRHHILQNKLGWEQPIEFPVTDALNHHKCLPIITTVDVSLCHLGAGLVEVRQRARTNNNMALIPEKTQ